MARRPKPERVEAHYVTGQLVPLGFSGSLGSLPRTDLGKFYESAHAEAYLQTIRGPGVYSLWIEQRTESSRP